MNRIRDVFVLFSVFIMFLFYTFIIGAESRNNNVIPKNRRITIKTLEQSISRKFINNQEFIDSINDIKIKNDFLKRHENGGIEERYLVLSIDNRMYIYEILNNTMHAYLYYSNR
jgi:hypothetical protein